MLYPKDRAAGGTWIGISDKNRLLCLLNGGFQGHVRRSDYRLSRGVIVKDLLKSNDLQSTIKNYDFKGIEPFTIVVADWQFGLKFFELVWDGKESHFKDILLDTHIWSSSTLYSDKMKKERHQWFFHYSSVNDLNSRSILNFHSDISENKEYGIVMDRGYVKTTSVTQVVKNGNGLKMSFTDLESKLNSVVNFKTPEVNYE